MDCQPVDKTAVFIFDHDKVWVGAATTVLENAGYRVVSETDDFGRCKELCATNMFMVMVVNLESVPDLAPNLKELAELNAHMDLLLTQNDTDPGPLDALKRAGVNTDYRFRPKNDHLVTEMGPEVTEIIDRRGRGRRDLELEWPEDLYDILAGMARNNPGLARHPNPKRATASLRDELELVLRHVFAPKLGQEKISERVRVEPFRSEGGHSSSELFKVTPVVLLDTGYNKSALLKFGPKEETLQESRNYDRFVEWFLRRDQTVRKIAYAEGRDFAGIVYSFPRDDEAGFTKFSDLLRQRAAEPSLAVVEAIFSPQNKHWLAVDGNCFLSDGEVTYQSYYFERVLFCSPYDLRHRHRKRMLDQLEKLEKATGKDIYSSGRDFSLSALSKSFPDPVEFLTKSPCVEELKMTVVHGDLHADNILLDEQDGNSEPRYYFIDFKYTGLGHIYRDFLELELAVRYCLFFSSQLPPRQRARAERGNDVSWEGQKRLLSLENALIKSTVKGQEPQEPYLREDHELYDPQLAKAYQVIKRIRELARANHPEGMRHYFLGMIPAALRALRYHTYPLDVRLSRYVLAGLYTDLAPRLDKLL
jgi:hypothetical protein